MPRIIPGVEVKVVKEVVPQQLAPSGVLGLVGFIDWNNEREEDGTARDIIRAGSWNTFIEECGLGSSNSLPEARQALENGVFELVVSPLETKSDNIAKASIAPALSIEARCGGTRANGIKLECSINEKNGLLLEVYKAGKKESTEKYTNLTFLEGFENSIQTMLEDESLLLRARVSKPLKIVEAGEETALGSTTKSLIQNSDGNDVLSISGHGTNTYTFVKDSNGLTFTLKSDSGEVLGSCSKISGEWALVQALEKIKTGNEGYFDYTFTDVDYQPTGAEFTLAGGTDASEDDYQLAVNRLDNESDVDMVLAAVQDFSDVDKVIGIYSGVQSHCRNMSKDSKGRIGFGQVPYKTNDDAVEKMASALVSDRFVLTAPYDLVGAVAGMIGNLSYYESPTFKTLSGIGVPGEKLGVETQRKYLRSNVVPAAIEKGKGLIVIRGLTTDGDQINVRRIADRAVRGVKMIGDLFIGRLNTEDGRNALKQKLVEFLLQMEREGAIVPSTDGTDPAFKVDVYSTQRDFALGIVRVDLATRPVRAIDYIYATVLVQV